MIPLNVQGEKQPSSELTIRPNRKKDWIIDALLILILIVGIYLRLTGVKWDDGTHLHPDERFLTMVETSISPVNSL